jgi:ubiquinol-cytochrome c reductase cytochrome b subunit
MALPAQPAPRWKNWVEQRLPVFSLMHELNDYPEPRNLNYWWNFGSLAGITLVIMIVTGIVLAMHYTPHVDHAFDSVERIMRDVNHGWLLRYIHANGAAMFFLAVYIHIFRGLYYGSYKAPREIIWWLGIIILLIMMATAFMGYVLPWGQMSFWAAKVITSLFSAIPLVGPDITVWLWGGYSVDNPTLNRFFSLHYLLPFILVAIVVVHIWALRTVGSGNPLGIEVKTPKDTIPFHPYYTVKDLFGLGVFLLVWAAFVFFAPNFMSHPDNYIPADPLKTPAHIVPEWYFLPYYAILRATPDILFINAKLAGVLAMFGSILILFLLPWLDSSKVRSANYRPMYRVFFWVLVIDCIVLGFAGAYPPEGAWLAIARVATAYYFFHFIILLPLISRIETPKPLPFSISQPVLQPALQRS